MKASHHKSSHYSFPTALLTWLKHGFNFNIAKIIIMFKIMFGFCSFSSAVFALMQHIGKDEECERGENTCVALVSLILEGPVQP